MTAEALSNQIHAVRVVEAGDIGGDVERFYTEFALEPVIVRSVYPDNPFLSRLSLDKIADLFQGQPLRVYDFSTQDYIFVPASDLVDDMRRGIARHNVTDHYLTDTPYANEFEVPSFLKFNWFVGSGLGTDKFEKSMTITPAGSFTPIHLDSYGMQGWMYLNAGKKVWQLYPPHYTPVLFDATMREFYNERQHPAERFPLAGMAEKYVGTLHGGELMFFPGGWAHQVETLEPSLGVGGSVINDYQVEQHMRSWLWERTFWSGLHSLDLRDMLLHLPPERFSGEAGRRRTQNALDYYDVWARQMEWLRRAN